MGGERGWFRAWQNTATAGWRSGGMDYALCGLGRRPGPSAAPFGTVGLGDVLGILRGLEVRVLGDGVEQNGDFTGHGRECQLACLAVGDEPLVEFPQHVVVPRRAHGGHVQGLREFAPASFRAGLPLDRAALVADRRVPAHLGDALVVELPDVWAFGEHRPGEARADALDLPESPVEVFQALVRRDGRGALLLDPLDVPVDALERVPEVLRRLRVEVVLELVGDDVPGLLEVPARADALFEAFLRV